MKRAALSAVILAIALGSNAAPARAEFIVDTFSPTNGFNTGTGPGNTHPINVPSLVNIRSDAAMAFTPAATRQAFAIRFAGRIIPASGTPTLQAFLANNVAGAPGVAISEIATFTNVPGTPTILSATFNVTPLLLAGQQVWFVVRSDPAAPAVPLGEWNLNSIGVTGPTASSDSGGGNWSVVTGTQGAFSVVAVVPEPSSLVLAGLSSCGLFGFAWRRRKQVA